MAKKTKTLEALEKAVRSYNQKINRAVKSGKIPFEARPRAASIRELKAETAGMTPKQRYAYYKSWEKELSQIHKPGALSVVKADSGDLVTQYEYESVKRQYKRASVRAKAEAERAEKDAQSIPQIKGVPVEDVRAYGKQHRPPKPHAVDRRWHDFESRMSSLKALSQHALGGEWAEYRAELIMNIEKNYSKYYARKLKAELEKISNDQLEKAYHAGAEFADQDFHYDVKYMEDSAQRRREMFSKMAEYQ